MWPPATKDFIEKNIEWCNDILSLDSNYLKFWDLIKTEPEKWVEHSKGMESDGFWVVAILGRNVIYYNDLEEGFIISKYTKYGTIDEYGCNQSELHDLVEHMYLEIFKK